MSIHATAATATATAVAALLLGACSSGRAESDPPAFDRDAVVAEVEARWAEGMAAAQRRDHGAVMALFDPEAVLPIGADGALLGFDAFRAWGAEVYPTLSAFEVDGVETHVLPLGPDLAAMASSLHVRMLDSAGAVVLDSDAAYSGVWRRTDGEWRIVSWHESIPSSDLLPGDPAP